MSDSDIPLLTYTYLVEDAIHEFIFGATNRETVEDYRQHVLRINEEWMQANQPEQAIRLIMDIHRSGMPSLMTVTRSSNEMAQQVKRPTVYIAYLTDSAKDRRVIDSLPYITDRRLNNTRQIFPSQQRSAAIAWLRAQG